MGPLRLTLLGGFQAHAVSGLKAIHLGRKAQGLLAYLGTRPGEAHTRGRLTGLLWGSVTEAQARHSLRQVLLELRRALSEAGASAVSVQGETIVMNPRAVEVDVVAFEHLVAKGTPLAVERAAALYRGDLLEGLRVDEALFEEWLSSERERLRSVALNAFQKLLGHWLHVGDTERVIHTALRVLRIDATQEVVHRTLMWLYLQMGQRGTALRQYRACVSILERELGVPPAIETRRLYEQIIGDRHPGGAKSPARPAAPAILVVEADPGTRSIVQDYLRIGGYDVAGVRDGAEALWQLDHARFDLILADVARSMTAGLKLAAILGRHGSETPVVFLASRPHSVALADLEPGAGYVGKPVQEDVLLDTVGRALRAWNRDAGGQVSALE